MKEMEMEMEGLKKEVSRINCQHGFLVGGWRWVVVGVQSYFQVKPYLDRAELVFCKRHNSQNTQV